MKLQGPRAADFCRGPDPALAGALLHGPDPSLLSLRRRDLVRALVGEAPMRVARLEADTLRRDPAALEATVRARGFFADRQAVVIEGAKDALAEPIARLLPELGPEDGYLVLTATGLTARSALRRLFEGAPQLVAIGLYPDPPDPQEIAQRISAAGGPSRLAPDAAARLADLAQEIDQGSLERFAETLALYAAGAEEIAGTDIDALRPSAGGAETDALVDAVAGAQVQAIGPLLARLAARGTTPQGALAVVSRHFRRLFALSTHPEGAAAAVRSARPPVFGPRRDALIGQLGIWSGARLDTALTHLAETERRLRSPGARPEAALAERCLLRLAQIGAAARR